MGNYRFLTFEVPSFSFYLLKVKSGIFDSED